MGHPITSRAGNARRFAFLALLLCVATVWPALAWAQASTYCPPQSATVANGGSVSINVSTCDGPFDGGMSEPWPGTGTVAAHGTVLIGANSGGTQFVTYSHSGNAATSDSFQLEDNDGLLLDFTITITPPASAIAVLPATLPAPTAGVAYSQSLSASGGVAPYTYSLSSGVLPPGLTLTSTGVISGTPTQRGGYAFGVLVQDAVGDSVVKGYNGSVANPTLTMTASGSAVQNVAYSQTLAASGGVAPYDFFLETGTLPAGIVLSSAGVISGTTAAAPGNYPVTVRVTDSSTGSGSYFELEPFTLAVTPPPSVSIAVAPATVSEDGATNLVYTVTRSANLASPTVVNLTTGGTATAGVDYTGSVASVSIAAGATTATVTINPTLDTTVEADETVTLAVAAGTGYTVGAPASVTGTILNDDVPSASIAVAPGSVSEDGAGNLVYTVSLSQASLSPVSVNFTVAGSATGADYAIAASPLVIAAGSTSGTIVANPTADASIEADETVVVSLAAGAGYTIGAPASASGTVLNDDLPTLTIDDVLMVEGDAGTTNATFTVSLSNTAGPGGVTFDIATANGTAIAGSDYVASSLASQTIPTDNGIYTFTVQVNGDALNESTETFFVNVTNVVNAVVADGQGLATIVNDDPLPTLSISDASVVEANAGTTAAVFTVSLSAASGRAVSVGYASANGSATAGSDYAATSGVLNFAAGQTAQTITVQVNGDTTPESSETFRVDLASATGAAIADGQGLGTIVNDDVPVTVGPATLSPATVATAYAASVSASGGAAPHTFAISAGALPSGVSLSSAGALSGTPTAAGTFNFTVTATDASASPGPYTGSRAYTLTVAAPTIALPATALTGGTLGQAYSAAITGASGGTAPYSYAVTAGALPAGLTLNASSGAITGTPTAIGPASFSITATDSSTGSGPFAATQAYAITVVDVAPVANPSAQAVAYAAAATPVALNISGGAPDSVALATLPAHGTAIASGTAISYQPAAGFAGTDSFTYTASNSGGTSAAATVTVTVGGPAISVAASGALTANVGVAYSQTFTWTGGAAPYSGFQVGNLPAGLSVTATSANSVTVSGTPTAAGTFNLAVQATDSSTGDGPYTGAQVFALVVAAPAVSLSPGAGTFNATYGAAFAQAYSASGGVGPYAYTAAGNLPPGVTLSGDRLTGTPTAPGSYVFTITATDTGSSGAGAPFTASQSYTLVVAAPLIALTPATLADATAAAAYSQSLSATGGAAPYTYAVTAGSLPAGLSLSASGLLSGTPTASGNFNASVRATDAHGQFADRAYTLAVAAPVLSLTPATLPAATAGTAYQQVLTVAGGIAPYTTTLTGPLPAGLAFDPATRTLAGTPTEAGSFPLVVTVSDSTGGSAATVTASYTLTVAAPTLSLTPATVPAGVAGVAYRQAFVAGGGIAPYRYTVVAGALPAGLALDEASGTLAGTPTQAGSFAFTVGAQDSTGGVANSVSVAYALTLSAPVIAITPATLPSATAQLAFSQPLSASGGTAPYAFAITAGALPPGLALANDGTLSGTPTVDGAFGFTVTATDALGFTGAQAYTLAVASRPDPSRDPEVRGLLDAQAQSTQRFASTQISNFQQRMESLHGAAGRSERFRNGLTFVASSNCLADDGQEPQAGCSLTASNDEHPVAPRAATPRQPEDAGAFSLWIGGAIRSGNTDGRGGGSGVDFETDGLSVGADYHLTETFALGMGVGYGRDNGDIGDRASRLEGQSRTLAAYASFHPGRSFFVDALLGYQDLSFDLRRQLTAGTGTVNGSRDGSQRFASLSAGVDLDRGSWQLTPYARLDVTRATLDGYREHGDPVYALAYGEQDVDTTTGNLGVRMEMHRDTVWGVFSPQFRLEYQHDFQADGVATMRYADLPTGPVYAADVAGFDRSRYLLGLGTTFVMNRDFSIRVEYRGLFGSSGDRDNGLQLNFQKTY